MDSPLETDALAGGPSPQPQPAPQVRIGANEISFSSASDELLAQRRREEKLASLAAKRVERLVARDDRRVASAGAKADGGSLGVATPEAFDSIFGQQVKEFSSQTATFVASGPGTEAAGKLAHDALLARVSALQDLLNDAAVFLPPHDVRKSQVIIDGLHAVADDTRARIVPRKKFAFSKRPGGSAAAPDAAASVGEASMPAAAAEAPPPELAEDSETIDCREGELICIMPPEPTVPAPPGASAAGGGVGGGRDLRLSHLRDCTVVLLEPLRALRIDGLVRCHVYTGGVAGSLLLHGCSDCVIVTAVRQARLHTSTRCDFYLHSASRPIIEYCRGLRFAPYTLRFAGVRAALEAAGLVRSGALLPGPEDGPAAAWRQVDDFRWLRVQASPNWGLTPPGEWLRARGGSGALAAHPGASDLLVPEDMRYLRPAVEALGLSAVLLQTAETAAALLLATGPPDKDTGAVAASAAPAAPVAASPALPLAAPALKAAPAASDDDEL